MLLFNEVPLQKHLRLHPEKNGAPSGSSRAPTSQRPRPGRRPSNPPGGVLGREHGWTTARYNTHGRVCVLGGSYWKHRMKHWKRHPRKLNEYQEIRVSFMYSKGTVFWRRNDQRYLVLRSTQDKISTWHGLLIFSSNTPQLEYEWLWLNQT